MMRTYFILLIIILCSCLAQKLGELVGIGEEKSLSQVFNNVVTPVWNEVVAKHQDGLLDPKHSSSSEIIPLKLEEASYHFKAIQEGVVDSARFLITFGIAISISNSPSRLLKAIAKNDLITVKYLLEEEGVSVEEGEDSLFESTPLHYAASFQNTSEIVIELIKHGASVEARGKHGATPLMIAACMNNFQVIQVLIEKGNADINGKHSFASTTALHFASEMGHVKTIELLCKLGANVESKTSSGGTPLHTACDSNRPEAVRQLLGDVCKANPNALLNGDTTPLYLASQRGFHQVVIELIKNSNETNINFVMPSQGGGENANKRGIVPIMMKETHVFYDYTQKNTEIGNGATALHAAAENGHLKTVDVLLKLGASQLACMEGSSPLVIALQYNHPSIALRLLKEKDPKINSKTNRDGSFALFVASGMGLDNIVIEILNRSDVLINLKNNFKATSLSNALYRKQYRIVQLLLARNAIVDDMAIKGILSNYPVPFDLFLKLLLKYQEKLDDILRYYVGLETGKDKKVIELLLKQYKADPSSYDDDLGANSIHIASQSGNLQALQIFAENLNFQKFLHLQTKGKVFSITPLYLAANDGHFNVVSFLLKNNANPNLGGTILVNDNLEEISPLYVASEKGYENIVEILLKYGANVNEGRNKYILPIEIATTNEHVPVMKILLEKNPNHAEIALRTCMKYCKIKLGKVLEEIVEYPLELKVKIEEMVRLILRQAQQSTAIDHHQLIQAVNLLKKGWKKVTLDKQIHFPPLHAAIVAYSDEEDEEESENKALEIVRVLLFPDDDEKEDDNNVLQQVLEQKTVKSSLTSLAIAVEAQRVKIVRELLKKIDSHSRILSFENTKGENIKQMAMRLRNSELIKIFGAINSDEL